MTDEQRALRQVEAAICAYMDAPETFQLYDSEHQSLIDALSVARKVLGRTAPPGHPSPPAGDEGGRG
jgi:hypothetical protein